MLLAETIHGGDSLIDLSVEEVQESGFGISRVRASALANSAQRLAIE